MNVKMIDQNKKNGRISFLVSDTTPSFVNALRRTMLDSVPTMAIEDVEIRKNTSILYDEVIAHRLGLCALTTDLKSYVETSTCKCKGEGCARCSVHLTLKAKNVGYVYASEMKSKDSKIKPVFPKTPLVKLTKGQEIELVATAMLGNSKEHAKWSSGLAYYKYYPQVDTSKCTDPQAVIAQCPKGAFFEVKGNKLIVNEDKMLKSAMAGACFQVAEQHGCTITGDKTKFIFYLEPWGQLSAKEIAATAADKFREELAEFSAQLSQAK